MKVVYVNRYSKIRQLDSKVAQLRRTSFKWLVVPVGLLAFTYVLQSVTMLCVSGVSLLFTIFYRIMLQRKCNMLVKRINELEVSPQVANEQVRRLLVGGSPAVQVGTRVYRVDTHKICNDLTVDYTKNCVYLNTGFYEGEALK